MTKRVASISLDLDDEWTYLKTHGDAVWKEYPSYLSYAVPRILDFLDEKNLKITFFIVGQDAAFDRNRSVLKEIAHRGHDVANHSFHHDPWLHLYSVEEINEELSMAEDYIEAATGIRPKGFRGPGFSCSQSVIKVLNQRNYRYDASTFPNVLNPLARAYFLWTSKMSKEERAIRKGLFGSWKDGFAPNKPFFWNFEKDSMLEIPVTTMPFFKIPIHASYLLYLSTFKKGLANAYLQFAVGLCKISGTQPSFLLHPLDFLGCDDTSRLSFFPAMNTHAGNKMEVMEHVFDVLLKNFSCITMQAHAGFLQKEKQLSNVSVA